MRTLPASCLFAFLLLVRSVAGQIDSEADFLRAVRTACEEKNAAKLDAMTYTVGMSPEDKEGLAQRGEILSGIGTITAVSVQPVTADVQSTFILKGRKYEPTYAPVGEVRIESEQTSGNGWISLPYAVIDGHYFIVTSKSTPVQTSGPPDVNIGFMVVGPGQDKVAIEARYSVSGKETERSFQSPSSSFIGQYISQITVTSDRPETDVTLTVLQDGREIYQSAPLRGVGKLKYRR